MKILIVGEKSRKIHLDDFSDELINLGIESKVIVDTDFIEKTLNLKFGEKRLKKKKRDEILSSFNPDVVLLDRISRIGEFFLRKKIPLFILLRGNYWEEVNWAKSTSEKSNFNTLSIYRNKKLADKIFSQATGILTISEYLKNETIKRYPGKKIDVIYADGRKISEWTKKKDQNFNHPCVGLVQGLNIWGKTRELETLQDVMEKMPNVTFYFAGDGSYNEKIIPKLKKYKNFIWVGNLEYPEKIKEFFSSIDVFLLLSGLEGLGQSIIEAMLMEKPVIATKTGGIPEIIDDKKSGFLVNSGQSKEIIFLINEILTKPDIREKIIITAKKNVQIFSWSNIAIEFFEILKKHRLTGSSVK